ncbi:MAG: hypothetical protein JF588_17130 [Caulobacterales bacterium]|nr:hypothetical protein [Caulobacterales bacterium]
MGRTTTSALVRATIQATALAATVLSAAALSGCKTPSGSPGDPQGWNSAARAAWYNGDQGSRLMPLKWMQALEQPGSAGGRFLDPAYLAGFRILSPWPGQTLPIGFAVDRMDDHALVRTRLHWGGSSAGDDRVDWVGLNCAACHTGQMTYGGKTLTIDGAPSLFDFQGFIEAADAALVQTWESANGADMARWNRFATAVLAGGDDTPENRAQLKAALKRLIDWESATEALNHTDSRYGYGRVDAVGHIYNRTLLFGGAAQPFPNPADAPVSYPHLWNITKQTQLQWDGIASSAKIAVGATPTDFGAMGRNVGEVLGVFGEAVIKPPAHPGDLTGFVSTARVDSLNAMEVLVAKLQPPAWPTAFGAPGDGVTDAAGKAVTRKAALEAGAAVFGDRCAACHTPHEHYETMRTFAQMGPEQTDEWMACNAWAYRGLSGALAGVPASYLNGAPLGQAEPVRQLLTTTVKGSLVGKKGEFVKAAAANIFGVTPLPTVVKPQFARPGVTAKDIRLQFCQQNASDPLLAYKGRPLEGIWATAPYLHNGSVPTLYDLLLPVDERPVTFAMGTRAFDPKKVGYDTDPAAPGNSFTFDTRIAGNSNKGHVYGVDRLTPTERAELLEYLKGL